MEITLLVAKIFSAAIFILGLSLVARPNNWSAYVNYIFKQKHGALGIALVALPFALLIVLTHQIWMWHPIVIITIMGWAMLIKYIAYIFCPHWGEKMLPKTEAKRAEWLKWAGVVYTVIGALLVNYTIISPAAFYL